MAIAVSKKGKGRTPSTLWRHLFALVLVVFALFPIFVVISSSLSKAGALATGSIFPKTVSFKNYLLLFQSSTIPFGRWMLNTILLSGVNAVVSVLIGVFAAFAFSRLRYRGRKQSLQALFLIQVFPSFLALAAIYVIFEHLSKLYPVIGLGSLGGLLLVYLGGSMGGSAWLLKGFLDTIPMELDEAAKIDGASPSQIFWQIFLPLTTPILVVTTLLSFIGTFNEFVLASIFLPDVNTRTVAVGLQSFVGGTFGQNWGPFAAGSVVAAIPLVALFLSLQKYIVSGVTAGSVKG
jgi:arabinogalactan oligomer / maltooligosaccharide transport system permease protein